MMRLQVISICRNEAQTIEELIGRIPKKIHGVTETSVTIIDDGSTDNTAELARKAGAAVLQDGAGKGVADRFREAVDYALAQKLT